MNVNILPAPVFFDKITEAVKAIEEKELSSDIFSLEYLRNISLRAIEEEQHGLPEKLAKQKEDMSTQFEQKVGKIKQKLEIKHKEDAVKMALGLPIVSNDDYLTEEEHKDIKASMVLLESHVTNFLILHSGRKHKSEELRKKLKIINIFCQVIIDAHPISKDKTNEIVQTLATDILSVIFSYCQESLVNFYKVSTVWRKASLPVFFSCIKMINERKHLELRSLEEKFTCNGLVQWLVKNPYCKNLEYFNFEGVEKGGLDNSHFEILTIECPNLKDLSISGKLNGDALKYLKNISKLEKFTIFICKRLEKDALKHLEHVPLLKELIVCYSPQIEIDQIPKTLVDLKVTTEKTL